MKRKSQVDLAVTIGAIIIPAAALIGSLVFAFSLLGLMVDAAKMAASIDHDLAVLQDVVSSSPDSITIYYKPTSLCKYNSNQQRFNCLDNKVTISGPMQNNYYRYTLLDSMVGDGSYHILPYYNSISLSVYYLDESTLKMVPLPGMEYRDYASIFDYVDSAVSGSNSISSSTPLTVANGAIQITKTREIVDRAQTPVDSQEDLIFPIVQAINSVCKGGEARNIAIKIPPHLGIAFDDSAKSITEFEYTYDISYDAYYINNFPEKQINLATVSLPNDFQCTLNLPGSSYPANDHFLKHILKLDVSKTGSTVTVKEDSP